MFMSVKLVLSGEWHGCPVYWDVIGLPFEINIAK